MKYLFFLVLLTNIVLFLWEINSGVHVTDSRSEVFRTESDKLILLLSEVGSVVATENNNFGRGDIQADSALEQEEHSLTSINQEHIQQAEVDQAEEQEGNVEDEPGMDEKSVLEEGVEEEYEMESELLSLQNPQEDPKIDQEANSETDNTVVSDKEAQGESENTELKSTTVESGNEVTASEADNRIVTEDRIVHSLPQNTDGLSEQNKQELSCYEVGPFTDEATLQRWKSQLNEQINILETLSRDIEGVKDYMVYYPAAETFEKSQENVKWLQELGINDFWLFLKGDMRGAISLGLFLTELLAESAREQYKEDGLDVQIKPRYQKVQRYFIRLELDEQQQDSVLQLTAAIKDMELSTCTGIR